MPVDGIGQINVFAARLRNVPEDTRRQVRKAIVKATGPLVDDMKRRASWSSRIPGAIGTRVEFSQARVTIRVNSRAAPHARPYEGIDGNRQFRHPVFGGPAWVTQATRPFFLPAVKAHTSRVRAAVEEAITRTLPK